MFEFLTKQRYPVLLVSLGFLLVIASSFKVDDIKKSRGTKDSKPELAPKVLKRVLRTATGMFH
jgi:predicted signal transduction protein with EAL and GGDEF domain